MNLFNKKTNSKVAQNTQDPDVQLAALVEQAKKINQNIDKISKETQKGLNYVEYEVDKKSDTIDDITSDLDKTDKKAEDDFDQLAIDQVDESPE